MDDLRVGALFRAVRKRRRLTQTSVATMAGVSQQLVALIEAGRLEVVSVRSLRRVGGVLEIGMPFVPRWRGVEAARLLDREHARTVELVVGLLHRWNWEVLVEHTFNHFGERGSIDIGGWHSASRTLLVVDVKTRVLDLQDLLAALEAAATSGGGCARRQEASRASGFSHLPTELVECGGLARREARCHRATNAIGEARDAGLESTPRGTSYQLDW